jgi:hypothetical protein
MVKTGPRILFLFGAHLTCGKAKATSAHVETTTTTGPRDEGRIGKKGEIPSPLRGEEGDVRRLCGSRFCSLRWWPGRVPLLSPRSAVVPMPRRRRRGFRGSRSR